MLDEYIPCHDPQRGHHGVLSRECVVEAGHLKRVASRHLKPLVPCRYHFRAAGDGSDMTSCAASRAWVTTTRPMPPVEPKTMIFMKSDSSYSFYPR
jgi:hypothetical protein